MRKVLSLFAMVVLAAGLTVSLVPSASAAIPPTSYHECLNEGGETVSSRTNQFGTFYLCRLVVDDVTYEFESDQSNAGFVIGVETTTVYEIESQHPANTLETDTTYGDVVSCENRGGNQIGGSNDKSNAMEKNKNCQPTGVPE